MTAITIKRPRISGFALILVAPATESQDQTPAPEFDTEASLAAAGWIDVDTRDQIAAALRTKPRSATSPINN